MSNNSMVIKNQQYLDFLKTVSSHPNMGLFHRITDAMYNLGFHCQQKENKTPLNRSANQLRFGDIYYSLNHNVIDSLMSFQYQYKHKNKNVPKGKEKSLFHNAIKDIVLILEKDHHNTSKYNHFYREFFKMSNAENFLYDYMYHLILSNSAKENYTYKLTRLSISLAEAMLQFIIMEDPYLRIIFKCFNLDSEKPNVKHRINIPQLKLIITGILDKKLSQESRMRIFNDTNIKNKTMQIYIMDYIESLILKEYYKNTIYIEEIRDLIKSMLENNIISQENDQNTNTEHYLTLGYYLIDYFIHQHLFTKESLIKKGKTSINIKASADFVCEIFAKKPQQIPYLTLEQLDTNDHTKLNNYQDIIKQNIGKLIHENPRIFMRINDDCYINKNKLVTRLTINIHQLIAILDLLMEGMKKDYLYTILDIDLATIEKLEENEAFKNILELLITDALSFNNPMKANYYHNKLKDLEKGIVKTYKDNPYKDSDKEKEEYHLECLKYFKHSKYYKQLLIDVINKTCQRRNLFTTLIEDAIYHSIFKYFIVTSYLDARSRMYSSAIGLNIHNNPLAKMIVNLYDRNEGRVKDLAEFVRLTDIMRYEQTKKALEKLVPLVRNIDNKNKNRKDNFKFIVTFLNISDEDLSNLIKNKTLCKNTKALLDYLLNIIKKPKKLFYVLSLIQ